ncbi:8426_t:CDS:2 [Funneliformis geosporum]|uniref:8426_t:CDS:1 n=1 Tax=Funneliformis geosporum TaxID=1117311 RepID=A0A9W4SIF0_9GLOM|nr:8426_t:CDS:2 [Funneliformis geosporum]
MRRYKAFSEREERDIKSCEREEENMDEEQGFNSFKKYNSAFVERGEAHDRFNNI